MNNLVVSKKGKSFCDSRTVAEKFGKPHIDVLRVIKKLEKDFDNLRVVSNHPKIIEKLAEYRGQTFKYYEMDRKFFSLLAMRFKGEKAFEWQIKFNEAFYEMERVLVQTQSNQQNEMWLAQREHAKLIRKEETDVIQKFVDYATKQGSKNAKFYYKHITNVCYKCLNLIQYKKPALRETLDIMKTGQLILAEKVAKKSLLKYMDDGEHYKTIFVLVKQDLEKFSDLFLLK